MNLDQRSGRPAEKHFSLLCSQARITCNGSDEDDHGWDFIVEVPMLTSDALSADLVGEIRKCEVQVKGPQKAKPVVKLSLANARAFSKSQLPCFLVAILDENTPRPRVFIRHFWKPEIEKTLKRLREAGTKGQKLNKTFIQFTLSESEERSPDAIDWLVNTVQNFTNKYGSEKSLFEQTVGYKDGQWKGEVKFGAMESIEKLVDHQLGLSENIAVDHISMTETRFDIQSPLPIFDGQPTLVKMRSLAKRECQMIFRSKDGESMSIASEVTAPAIPNLPPEALKLRIESLFFSAVISSGKKVDINLNLDFETPITLEKLNQFFQILSWGEEGPIEFCIVGGGLPLSEGHININQGKDGLSFTGPTKITAKLLDITHRAGGNSHPVTPTTIFRNWNECSRFYNYLTTDGAKLEITLDREFPSDTPLHGLVGYIELNLETVAFVAVLELPIEHQERNGNDLIISLGRPLIRDCFVGNEIQAVCSLGEKRVEAFGNRTEKVLIKVGSLFNHTNESSAQ